MELHGSDLIFILRLVGYSADNSKESLDKSVLMALLTSISLVVFLLRNQFLAFHFPKHSNPYPPNYSNPLPPSQDVSSQA